MGRKTHGPILVEAIESNNLKLTSSILSKHFNNRSKLQQFLWSPVPRPLFECPTEVPMLLASSLADPSILNYLVASHGADINHVFISGHPKKPKKLTCLITAVRRSAYSVVSYLLNVGCDLNKADHKGRTALHHAVRRADFAMAKLLLSKGASHDKVDSAGNTPLHIATLYGHIQLVKLLVKSGADLYKQGHFGALPLHMAAREGHTHLVALFCCTLQANPSLKVPCYDGTEKSPLHLAAMRGHLETVRILVEECGALVDAKDPLGNTALHYCFSTFYDPLLEARSKEDHAETCRTLLEMGADPNARNVEGEAPLHMASKNEYEKGIEILLLMGANCGDEARNSAGSRPVDLLSDKSGASASILKTAARDPQGFLNETFEAMSRRGVNNSSTNLSFVGSTPGVGRHSSKFSEHESCLSSPRLPGMCSSSPRTVRTRTAGRTSNAPGLLNVAHQQSLESINRIHQHSKQAFQIEKCLQECMDDEDVYLAPEKIPFIHDIPDDHQQRSGSNSKQVTRNFKTGVPGNHRNRTPVGSSKKLHSENGSSSLWEVTPNASTTCTLPAYNRGCRKMSHGACNLSNVVEEQSETDAAEFSSRVIHKTIKRALDRVDRHRGTKYDDEGEENADNPSDFDDSFDTVSESEEENETLKRRVQSPSIRRQPTEPKRKSTTSWKWERSAGSVSSSFETESSSSNSTHFNRRRTPPPVPDDQLPYELEGTESLKKLFNVEVDGNQMEKWTILKFTPLFPSSQPMTFVLKSSLAKRVVKLLDKEKFLTKLVRSNFNLPECSTEGLQMSQDDFLGHEYENMMPSEYSERYSVKLCRDGSKSVWSREILKPRTAPKPQSSRIPNGHKPALPDRKPNNLSRRAPVPSSCSETDSFVSGTSGSSNEINSFIPKEARKKTQERPKQDTLSESSRQNGNVKRGFGLQKGCANADDARSKSWRAKKSYSQVDVELDETPEPTQTTLKSFPTKLNSASAENIIDRVDAASKTKKTSKEGPLSTYMNLEDAQEMKRIKSQQNVLKWFATNQESVDVNDDTPQIRGQSLKSNNYHVGHKGSSSNMKVPNQAVYEQLEDNSVSEFLNNESEKRTSGKFGNRVVIFERTSENLEFSVAGGNILGIFVNDVVAGSDAQKAGLKKGDELLDVNGKSLAGKTKEEAFRMLESCSHRLELKIKRNLDVRIKCENADKFFVQACFDFTPNAKDDEYDRVRQGDIFCVIDSMPEKRGNSWKAIKAESSCREEIYIPNKSKAIGIMAKAFVESGTIDKKSKGTSLLRSFRRNKSIDNDAKSSEINNEFLKPYKTVMLIPPSVKRPVFISGLFSEAICARLITDSPGLYEIPDKIVEVSRFVPDISSHQNGSLPRTMSNSSLSPIDIQPLKEISAKGKHSICCLSPKAIEYVRQQSDLNPIAIFLSCPSKQVVKDVASTLTFTNADIKRNNVVGSMFETSLRFEKFYGHLFDAILPLRSDSSWFSILKDTINKMQVIPKWRTVELLDDDVDGGTLVREKENPKHVMNSENRHSKTTDDLPESSKKYGIDETIPKSRSAKNGLWRKFSPSGSAQSMSDICNDTDSQSTFKGRKRN